MKLNQYFFNRPAKSTFSYQTNQTDEANSWQITKTLRDNNTKMEIKTRKKS